MTRHLYLNRRSDAAPPRASRMEKCFNAAVWQGGNQEPLRLRKPMRCPSPCLCLRLRHSQMFDSRVGGGSVQRLGAATVVLAGDRGRVASTCGSERGQRDLRGAQDAPPASLHHQHMQTSLSGICLRTMVTPVMCPPSAMRKVWRQRTCRVA